MPIPTAYDRAMERLKKVKPPLIPNCWLSLDMTHCRDKETYVAFLREWKEAYGWYARQTRSARIMHRLNVQISRLEKKVKHVAVAAHFQGDAGELYRLREERTRLDEERSRLMVVLVMPAWFERQTPWIRSHLRYAASWLMRVRMEAKIQAHLGWLERHPPRV